MDLYIVDEYEQGTAATPSDWVIIGQDEIDKVDGHKFERIYALGTKRLTEDQYDKLLPCSLNIHQLREWPDIHKHLTRIGML